MLKPPKPSPDRYPIYVFNNDNWPTTDMPAIGSWDRKDVPPPFQVLREIADKHMQIPIDSECERDGDSETGRDKWHPLRPTLSNLARKMGITPQYLSAMMNDRAPCGLKFAKNLYTYCRKNDMDLEAWRLRVSYEYYGSQGKYNPNRNKLGGTRKSIYTSPKSEAIERDQFNRKLLNMRMEFERRMKKRREFLFGYAPGLQKGPGGV